MPADVIEISSENVAWDILRKVLANQIDCEKSVLDFSKASWAKFHVKVDGDQFDQSVTPSLMKGLLDYQNALYHSVGILIHGDDKINKFTNFEKELYELVFSVKSGSSDISSNGKEALDELAKRVSEGVVKKMSARQIFILLLIVALMFFGMPSVNKWIEGAADAKKIDAELERNKSLIDLAKQISKDDKEKMDILERALTASPRARDIATHRDAALDSLVKNASRADNITVQGILIDNDAISSINRATRRASQETFINGYFIVTAVDTSEKHRRKVYLESTDGMHRTILAEIEDRVIYNSTHKAIRTAEWSRKPLYVRMSARVIGDDIRDAKIIRASAPRRRAVN